MVAFTTLLAVASLLTGTLAARQQSKQQRAAISAQEEAQQQQLELQEFAQARERRQALAESRRLRALAIQQGINQGVSQSSAIQGAAGALQTQTFSNIGFQNAQANTARNQTALLGAASNAQSNAATFGAVGQFANTIFSNSAKLGGFLNNPTGSVGATTATGLRSQPFTDAQFNQFLARN